MLPLWPELFRLLVVLVAGAFLFRLGSAAWARSPRQGVLTAVVAGAVTAAVASVHYQPMRQVAGPLVSRAGGEGTLACLGLILMLGVAWKAGRRFASRPLVVTAIILSSAILLTTNGAPLAWRWFGQPLMRNYPNSAGLIQQTTGMTCAPAAAAMLLNRYGLRVSEGQLAETAGTNPLVGTDEFALANAMELPAAGHNLRAAARRLSYQEAKQLACPFVAYIRRAGIGGHAILVLEIGETNVLTADPLSGETERMPRSSFEEEWSGVAIWLERSANRL